MAHFNIQISLTTRSSKTSFTFRFPDQNFVRNSDLHDACYLVVLNISTEQTSTQIYSTGSQLGYQLLEPPTWLPTVSIMSNNIFWRQKPCSNSEPIIYDQYATSVSVYSIREETM